MNRVPLPKASKAERPQALENGDHERLLNMIVALAAEVSVLQDQLDTTRRVLIQKAVASGDEFDHFEFDAEATAERAQRRNSLIERVMRIVIADAERAARDEQSYDELLAMVATEPASA